LGLLLKAGVVAVKGRVELSASILEDAAQGFDAAEMTLFAAVARRHQAVLVGDHTSQARIQRLDDFMRATGITNPGRMAATLAPGFRASSVASTRLAT
jgi:hypothetical protein